jgi:flagellar hook-associated protein 1
MSTLVNIGARAMFANQAALQVIGNNIANVNTVGYSRQQVEVATASSQYTGAGYFGKGVDVKTVSRAQNEFLNREVTVSRAQNTSDAARLKQLQQLEKVFPLGETGVGHAVNQFINSFVDVASQPQDPASRQVVLSRAEEMSARFRQAGEQINTLQTGVAQDLRTSVLKINDLAQRFAGLNAQITGIQGSGHVPNDLMDRRDQILRELNDQVQVTAIAADDGSLSLFVGGGQTLVLGSTPQVFTTIADEYDVHKLHVALSEGNSTRLLPDSQMPGGAIGGLLRFQTDDLMAARNLLGQMASAVSGAVNKQQALGLDLQLPNGPGGPMFAVDDPEILPSSRNAKDGLGNAVASYINGLGVRVPSVGVKILDASQLQASDYDLRADPGGGAGLYQLTRISDGLIRTVASGDKIDGFQLDVVAPLPASADTFLLRPVGAASATIRRVLDDPRGVAAAAQFTGVASAANVGTASVLDVRAVDPLADRTLSANIKFTSTTGNYDWELRNASNALVSSGSATWVAGQPIALNGWEMQINGAPQVNDTLKVAPTAYPAGNNGNATVLTGLRDLDLVGRRSLAGGATAGLPALGSGDTFTDAYSNALAEVGVRVQTQRTAESISGSVLADSEDARSSQAGVNLDEEAARLIQYQQAYQACAKIIQVAQSTFDTLLQIGR